MAAEKTPPRLLVIGNGPTGVSKDGDVHVDRGCGQFLEAVAKEAEVTFAQPVEQAEASLNYYGHVLDTGQVKPLLLDRTAIGRAVGGIGAIIVAIARADFVYLFFPGTLPRLVGRLCRLVRKPYGLFMRGSQFGSERADLTLIAQARFVLCVSQGIADEVSILNPRTSVVRSAQDLRAEDAWRRPDDGGDGSPLSLLYVGRIDEEKGIPELIAAARILHAEGRPFSLSVVGFGRMGAWLRRELELHPELPIEYLGAVEDRAALMELFKAAEIFVLPSHHEGFARVLYEAMLKSCAIVTTMVGGIPAVMKDEENCLAIPVGSAEAIAGAVRRLMDDRALVHDIGESALATVLEIIGRIPTHAEAMIARLLPGALPQGSASQVART